MTPIVNGLQDQFNSQIHFVSLRANDNGAGQAVFEALDLRGHPAVVVMMPDGEEIFRGFGVLDEDLLRDTLASVASG